MEESSMKRIPKQEYTAEFNNQTVKQMGEAGSISRVAAELGMVEQIPHNRVKSVKAAKLSPPSAPNRNMSERNSKLHGCWRLASFDTELQDSRERTQPWGAEPNGYLILGSDGRVMVLITAGAREPGSTDEKLAALFRTMMAYTGRYRIDGDRLITTVDSSWNEAWNGSQQERFYKLDGDTLDVVSAWMPNPIDLGKSMARGILRFRRE